MYVSYLAPSFLAAINLEISASGTELRDYAVRVIFALESRAYERMTFSGTPGRDVVLWIKLVESEAELVVGIETLAAYGPPRSQADKALYAEWLTHALADGPHRPLGLKAAFHSAGGGRCLEDWLFLEQVAKELGFVQGDLWQLPDDHPWQQTVSDDVI